MEDWNIGKARYEGLEGLKGFGFTIIPSFQYSIIPLDAVRHSLGRDDDSLSMDCFFSVDAILVGTQYSAGPANPDWLESFSSTRDHSD